MIKFSIPNKNNTIIKRQNQVINLKKNKKEVSSVKKF